MKQHITLEQFDKLSTKQKNNLLKWALEKEYVVRLPNGIDDLLGRPYYVPLLSIGQMIEFLDEHDKFPTLFKYCVGEKEWTLGHDEDHGVTFVDEHKNTELCNALWEAVKEVLNK